MLQFYKQLGFDIQSTDFLEALTQDPTLRAGLERGLTLPEIIIEMYKDKKKLSSTILKMSNLPPRSFTVEKVEKPEDLTLEEQPKKTK